MDSDASPRHGVSPRELKPLDGNLGVKEARGAAFGWLEGALQAERRQVDALLRQRHTAIMAQLRSQENLWQEAFEKSVARSQSQDGCEQIPPVKEPPDEDFRPPSEQTPSRPQSTPRPPVTAASAGADESQPPQLQLQLSYPRGHLRQKSGEDGGTSSLQSALRGDTSRSMSLGAISPAGRSANRSSQGYSSQGSYARPNGRHSVKRPSRFSTYSKDVVQAKVSEHFREMREREKEKDKAPLQRYRTVFTTNTLGHRERAPGLWGTLAYCVTSPQFEMFFGLLIIINTLVMATQRQYEGLESAATMGFYGTDVGAAESWPAAVDAFEILEWIFGVAFTLEVFCKLSAQRHMFFVESGWNWFDMGIVVCWLVDRFRLANILMNPMMLRLARLMRLLRLLRIVRWVKFFDPLNLMVKAIKSSVTVLMWSLLLLVMVICVIAMVCGQLLEDTIRDPQVPLWQRELVFTNWGTFSRSVVTMFEITLANWAPPCRLLMDNVNEWWGVFLLAYKCSIGFAVVNVITSVFIQQTFKVAARDEEIMIAEKQAQSQAYIKNLDNLFSVLDADDSGYLDEDEFKTVLNDTKVQTWFAALEVDVSEVSRLFELLDDGDGLITRAEFLEAVKKLRGSAKSSDMLWLIRSMKRVEKVVASIQAGVDRGKVSTRSERCYPLNQSDPIDLQFPAISEGMRC